MKDDYYNGDGQHQRQAFARGIEQLLRGEVGASFFTYLDRDYMIIRMGERREAVFRIYPDGSVKWLQRHPVGVPWGWAVMHPDSQMALETGMGRIL